MNVEELGFFTEDPQHPAIDRPYLTVVMQMGSQAKRPRTKKPQPSSATALPSTPSKIQALSGGTRVPTSQAAKDKNPKPVHPRYAISITGSSSAVYGVIDPSEEHLYAQLLVARSLKDEHPQKGLSFLDAVSKLKPSFEYDEPPWSWAEGMTEGPEGGVEDFVEEVTIGDDEDEDEDEGYIITEEETKTKATDGPDGHA